MLPASNDYQGEIISAELTEDDGRIAAIIRVRPEGSSEVARWRGTFDETVITKGTNQGRQWGELTAECLGEFGVTDFSRIAELKGAKCTFGVKHNPGKDNQGNPKIWVEVNFIHPLRVMKPVTSQGLASLNKFKAAAIDAARKSGAPRLPAAQPSGRRAERSVHGDAYEGALEDDFGPDPFA